MRRRGPFPKTGRVVRRRSETTCRTLDRFNRTRSGLPERKAGEFQIKERRPTPAPGRAATAHLIQMSLCADRSGLPVRERNLILPSVAPIRKDGRTSPYPAFGPRLAVRSLAGFSSAFPRVLLSGCLRQQGFGLAISRLPKARAGGAWLPVSKRSQP